MGGREWKVGIGGWSVGVGFWGGNWNEGSGLVDEMELKKEGCSFMAWSHHYYSFLSIKPTTDYYNPPWSTTFHHLCP